jgi:ABC-2 type transport system ATP-binding protein
VRLGLGERGQERLVALSHGNQQRVQLAVALVHAPKLLVLDEPFAGLDPEAVDALSEILRAQAGEGVAVLFSSHQLELVERLCERVVILEQGRRLAVGTLAELRGRFPALLRVRVEGSSEWADGLVGARVVRADGDGVLPSSQSASMRRRSCARRLSRDQDRLLRLVAEGRSIAKAAALLHVSQRTAERRLAAARASLGVRTTAEAALAVTELTTTGGHDPVVG